MQKIENDVNWTKDQQKAITQKAVDEGFGEFKTLK